MPLNNKITIREFEKFRDAGSGRPAVAVVNPDGSIIGGSPAASVGTVYQGTSPWLVSLNSTPTVTLGDMLPSGTNFIGFATTVISSAPTLYAIVNTGAIGTQNSLVTLLNSNANIGFATVAVSTPTLYAIVNTGAVGVQNSMVTLNASPNFIGLATVVPASIPALVASSAYIGLASVNIGGTLPPLATGSAFVGLATIILGRTPVLGVGDTNALFASTATGTAMFNILIDGAGHSADINTDGSLDVFASMNGNVTLNTSNAWIGLATTVNASSTAWIGLVSTASIQGKVSLVAGSAYVGLASVNIGGTLPALVAGTAYVGLASVNIGGTLPALTAGSAYIGLATTVNATSTAWIGLVSTASINGTVVIPSYNNKTFMRTPIALAGTNLSGATGLVAAASKKFYITNIMLSTASNIGITFLNGPTYLNGNASIRIQLGPQGGFVRDGDPMGAVYIGLAVQTNFLIATDTAAPLAGDIMWFEE